jgi:hypothetical protein
MQRLVSIAIASLVAIAATPALAHADFTTFLGVSTTPATRSAKGFAVGVGLVIIGFEFEYANVVEKATESAPSLRTGMINGLVQTPTKTQLYLTAGGGFFRERLGTASETSFGTNIGGGIKLSLAGPIRLRVDYRVFSLRGQPLYTNPQRVYGGLNIAF